MAALDPQRLRAHLWLAFGSARSVPFDWSPRLGRYLVGPVTISEATANAWWEAAWVREAGDHLTLTELGHEAVFDAFPKTATRRHPNPLLPTCSSHSQPKKRRT